NADEGWTRWLFEQYEFPYKSISDADVRAGDLRSRYDVIIIPSQSSERLRSGLSSELAPREYVGGLGDQGRNALKAFVADGGTVVALDQATAYAINGFDLPVRDVTHGTGTERFFCPGSILRVDVDPAQPLGYGMSAQTGGFFAFSSAYEILSPDSVAVAARYG